MLDGLEAVELKLSEVLIDNDSNRLDSEYFSRAFINVAFKLFLIPHDKLVNLTNKIDVGYVGAMTNEYVANGVILLQTKNIGEIFVDESSYKFISIDFHSKLLKSQIIQHDILIARSGSFGKASIYLGNEEVNSSDIIIIQSKNSQVNSYYLTVFLNSYYGAQQLYRFASGGVQGHVNLTILENLVVPILSMSFQMKIEGIIKLAYQKLEESKQLYKEAEDLLLSELGLLDFVPNDDNIAIKSFSDSFSVSGRLDSEYYQPKYDDIEQRIYSKPHTFINKEFSQIITSFDKTKDGYNYIEIGDVNVSDGIHSYNYVLTEELPANAKIKVDNGDLIVSTVRPYRGAVSIINTDDTDLVVSGAFTVLRSKLESNYSIQVLQVLLRTQIYKNFMLKYNVGSSYPVIKDENVMNLPIPLLGDKIQKQIESKIKQSFALKEQSKQLLELAKHAVEVAIENSEESAMELTNNAKY